MAFDLGEFHHNGVEVLPNQKLTWRMDPNESLSDWTLCIQTHDHEETIYHVHKAVLGADARSSKYFRRLFLSQMLESSTQRSEIFLEGSANKAIPIMLDFMYFIVQEVAATTETAVALRYLANYFEIENLFVSTNHFIQSDLTSSTAPLYLHEAGMYQDEKILDAASGLCAKFFEVLEEIKLNDLTPDLFRRVVTSPDLQSDSLILSLRIEDYCTNCNELTPTIFKELTDPQLMPTVHSDCAFQFLQLAMKHDLLYDEHDLKGRCATALSKRWEYVTFKGQDPIYHDFPADMKVELLEAAIATAQNDMKDTREANRERMNEMERHRANAKSQQNQIHRLQSDLNRAHEELRRFQRVPLSHDFEETFDARYMDDREDARGYNGRNEERSPLSMPSIGLTTPHPEMGYTMMVTTQKTMESSGRGGKVVNWPVFYYKSDKGVNSAFFR
jgi:hypothetical protein